MSRLVERNPFSREELHAKRVHYPPKGCQECGIRRETQSGTPWLYQFWCERDDSTRPGREDNHYFCSRECRSIYYGIPDTWICH